MPTPFAVAVNDQIKYVVAERDNYEAHAIILIESLKAFAGLSHADAVRFYTDATKQVREGSLSIENVIEVTPMLELVGDADLYIDNPIDEMGGVDAYWKVS